jgi:hypothetical protein
MAHRSTRISKRLEADRTRQRRRRERMRELGIPAAHQVDAAVTEAMSYTLALALADKEGVRAQPGAQTIRMHDVVKTAMDILVKRQGFHPDHAGAALKSRLAKRPEHSWPHYVPCFPSVSAAVRRDMSASQFHDTPVTPSGQVTPADG